MILGALQKKRGFYGKYDYGTGNTSWNGMQVTGQSGG